MPRRARARGGGGSGEEVKLEDDFVDSVLNFAGGGGGGEGEEEGDDGEEDQQQQQPAAAGKEFKSKNLAAERRRRSRLNGNIFALRAVMSKEATLSDAIEHIKNLQNEVLELQRQLGDSPGEAWEKQGSASCSESFVPPENTHYQGQVELISLGSCKYNLKIFWTKRAGLFTKVLEALCSYKVQVLSLNTISFYGYAESFFTVEVKDVFSTSLLELIPGEVVSNTHDAGEPTPQSLAPLASCSVESLAPDRCGFFVGDFTGFDRIQRWGRFDLIRGVNLSALAGGLAAVLGLAAMDHAELTTDQVLKRDIPWESYMANKLISGTCLQLLRRYDHKPESQRGPLLDEDGPSYVRVFLNILRNISKEETVEYVLALIDEMLAGGNLVAGDMIALESARPKIQNGIVPNGEASNSKSKLTSTQDVLRGLVDWLCSQLRNPAHPNCSIPTAMHCLATLLREQYVRALFVQLDGVKLLIPLISPASTQQSIQLLYETCLCIWLLSFYDAAVDYLSTTRVMPRLVDVVKGSTKEKVVRVVIMSIRNLLAKGAFAAQMIDLGLPHIVQNLKAQAWTDEDLLDALNQLEVGLKDNLKKLSSFEKYKQQVLLGHLDWSPMHKDPSFWRENINNFEENDFQILRVLMTIIDTSTDTTALAVACYDLSQFLQYHPSGRIVVADLKAKDRVMKLMNHENAEVRKNALLCVQRLFLGAKYASFLQT
uniref:Vacuolar proton pump subunit H n=1 Tax=Leersia perrieri TaxID=77586 RepID=A0A0D9X047_9ORYZ